MNPTLGLIALIVSLLTAGFVALMYFGPRIRFNSEANKLVDIALAKKLETKKIMENPVYGGKILAHEIKLPSGKVIHIKYLSRKIELGMGLSNELTFQKASDLLEGKAEEFPS